MKIIIFCYLALSCFDVFANDSIANINKIINRGQSRKWQWSVAVISESTGKLIFKHNASDKLVPASNQKLLTVHQALKTLGQDYQPEMEILYSGKITNGRLFGNLYIKGNGAIVFTSRFKDGSAKAKLDYLKKSLEPLKKILSDAHISRIEGNVQIVDDKKNERYPSATQNLFNENTIDTFVKGGVLTTIPQNQKAITIKSHRGGSKQKRIKNKKHQDIISIDYGRDSQDYWRVESPLKTNFFANQVSLYLKNNGFRLDNKKIKAKKLILLGKIKGLSIRDIVEPSLTYSDNLRAEVLYGYLLKAGKYKYLQRLGAIDGSGLSHLNKLSSLQILSTLRSLKSRWPWINNALAQPGKNGTLHNRYKNITGLHAKTGTLDGCLSLSGFLERKNGNLVFSIIINNVDKRKLGRDYIGWILSELVAYED